MSTRCNIKISANGIDQYLYQHMDGYPEDVGAIVSIAARKLLEGELSLPDLAPWFYASETYNFTSTTGTHGDIEYFYHIDISPSGNVIIGYCDRSMAYSPDFDWSVLEDHTKRYKVSTFIKTVNKARRSANYPYKMLRQPLAQPEPEADPRPYTTEERLEIANTILAQMGGGRLTAMIGMHNPVALDSPAGLKFNFRGSRKANICQVIYNPGSDTYDFELYKYTPVRYADCPCVYGESEVYCDMFQDLFTQFTGLTLTL